MTTIKPERQSNGKAREAATTTTAGEFFRANHGWLTGDRTGQDKCQQPAPAAAVQSNPFVPLPLLLFLLQEQGERRADSLSHTHRHSTHTTDSLGSSSQSVFLLFVHSTCAAAAGVPLSFFFFVVAGALVKCSLLFCFDFFLFFFILHLWWWCKKKGN